VTPPPHPGSPSEDDRRMHRTYAGVIVVEILVLLCLWVFQQHFGP
jgi:hypothetical protein